MGDMMGKLKELGNGILKPFGMSTEDFKMVKDEKTGGYSLSIGRGVRWVLGIEEGLGALGSVAWMRVSMENFRTVRNGTMGGLE